MDRADRDVLFLLAASMRSHGGDRNKKGRRRVPVDQIHKGPGPGIGREENEDKHLPPEGHGIERSWRKR
jgi:hypothetical protein